MAGEIAKAYVQILPSTKGIGEALSKGLDEESQKAGFKSGNSFSNAFGTATKAAGVAMAATTTAVTAFAKSSVSAGADFDTAMSQVAATMGITMDELSNNVVSVGDFTGNLRDFAQEMGSSTAFSATQAAEALNFMALAGYDAETSVSMLPNVLNLAAAGGIELATASDMVTDCQTALGLSLEETSTMVDQMAAAASSSNTSVAQLGEAFLTIGGTAKNLAGGTNELAQMLGVLADNGIKGSEAGTHLRNIMLAMNPTTDKAVAAWDKLGVSAYDADGKLRPLQDTFADLSVAMGDMTDQEKTDIITSMFNKTDLSSVNALLSTEVERYDQLSGLIKDSAGAASDMANTQLDNLVGDITLFESALEGAKITISDQLTPLLREFVQFGSEGVSTLTTAFNEGGLDGAMAALGTLLSDGLAMLIEILPQILEAGGMLLTTFIQGLLENLPALVETAIQMIGQLTMGIAQALPELIPTIVDIIGTIIDTLLDNLDLLIDCALQLIVGLAEGLITALPKLNEKGPQIISAIVESIVANLPQITATALELIITLATGLIKALPDLILQIPKIVKAIIDGLLAGINDIRSVGSDFVAGLWSGISGAWSGLVSSVTSLGSNLVSSVKGLFQIGSPSKLMRDEIGQWIPKGIAVGIENNTDAVTDAVSAITDETIGVSSDISSHIGMASVNADVSSIVPDKNDSALFDLLSQYLPQIAAGRNVTLEGDAAELFRVMRDQNKIYKNSTGKSAFA